MVIHFAFMFRAITAITHSFRVETTFIFHGLIIVRKTHWGLFVRQKTLDQLMVNGWFGFRLDPLFQGIFTSRFKPPGRVSEPTIRDLQCGCFACLVFEAWRSSAVVGGMGQARGVIYIYILPIGLTEDHIEYIYICMYIHIDMFIHIFTLLCIAFIWFVMICLVIWLNDLNAYICIHACLITMIQPIITIIPKEDSSPSSSNVTRFWQPQIYPRSRCHQCVINGVGDEHLLEKW